MLKTGLNCGHAEAQNILAEAKHIYRKSNVAGPAFQWMKCQPVCEV